MVDESKVQRISELVSGQKLFESHGLTRLRVTKNGKHEILEVPIKSTGAAAQIEELRESAPEPPKRLEKIDKDSDKGRELGLTTSEMYVCYDNTAPDYIKALNDHNQNFIWRLAVFALDIKWMKADGTEATTFEEKVEILKSNGIHGHHMDQIHKDAMALTKHSEDKQDFLSDNS